MLMGDMCKSILILVQLYLGLGPDFFGPNPGPKNAPTPGIRPNHQISCR